MPPPSLVRILRPSPQPAEAKLSVCLRTHQTASSVDRLVAQGLPKKVGRPLVQGGAKRVKTSVAPDVQAGQDPGRGGGTMQRARSRAEHEAVAGFSGDPEGSRVPAAAGQRQRPDRNRELPLEPLPGARDLPAQLGLGQAVEERVVEAVRSDEKALCGKPAELGPRGATGLSAP